MWLFMSLVMVLRMSFACLWCKCFCSGLFCARYFVRWLMFLSVVWLSSFMYVLLSSVGMNLCVSCRILWSSGVMGSVCGVMLM